jgi:hypothetical protein
LLLFAHNGFSFVVEFGNNWGLKPYSSIKPSSTALKWILKYLRAVAQSGEIYTYHFNLLRNVLEKTAAFHGFDKFSESHRHSLSPLNCRRLPTGFCLMLVVALRS